MTGDLRSLLVAQYSERSVLSFINILIPLPLALVTAVNVALLMRNSTWAGEFITSSSDASLSRLQPGVSSP